MTVPVHIGRTSQRPTHGRRRKLQASHTFALWTTQHTKRQFWRILDSVQQHFDEYNISI